MRFVLVMLAIGCSGDDPTSTDVPTVPLTPVPTDAPTCIEPVPTALNGICPLQDRIGGFRVDDLAEFTTVGGSVTDSVLPSDVFTAVDQVGDCALMGRPQLICDPACPSGETCNGTECVPFPSSTDRGRVVISGLESCVEMDPVPPGFNYFFNGLSNPGMAPGSPVQLDVSGTSLGGRGVAPLTVAAPDWLLLAGQDLPISWTPSDTPEAEIAVTLSIDQHGTSPLRLDCVFADTGSGTVPAAIVDGLIQSGVSGFPSGKIVRRTADHADLAEGCIDFIVASSRAHTVDVDGFTPCSRPEDCPHPQVCDLPNEICVDP